MSENEELLRVAVVEMRDNDTGESKFIAMAEDASDCIGYGNTSEAAIEDLEEKLVLTDSEAIWEPTQAHTEMYLC